MSFYAARQKIVQTISKFMFDMLVARQRQAQANIEFSSDIRLVGLPRLQVFKSSSLKIGSRCILRSTAASNPIGIDQPVTLCTATENAQIVIGNGVGISGGSICARQSIEIGDNTLIGANSYIFDHDFHPLDPIARANDDYSQVRSSPVHIGSNVFIGSRCIILKGVTIGNNAIIGAGSVVTQNIPSNAIAAGNPCIVKAKG